MSIQEKMFRDNRNPELFERATRHGLEYLDGISERNVYPTDEAISDLEKFDEPLPGKPSDAVEVLEKLNKYGSPATTAFMGSRYFGFVCGGIVPVGLAVKNLTTFWDQSPGMWVASPVGSKLEEVVERWLIDLFHLPENSCAGFVSGTTSANICGLAAARYRILQRNGWDVNKKGLWNAPQIRVVAGRDVHSSALKGISLLGFGVDNIEFVDVDEQGRMIPEMIPELDENTILMLQAGNVNSGAFDPFDQICKKAMDQGAWIHIDGAFGLWAEAVQGLNHLTSGIQYAHSWATDGHKTLNTPYDSGIIMCADPEALASALHMSASYIIESEQRDGMYYTPEMSRRARIFELWSIMKYLGREGMDEMVMSMHERARQFASDISQIEGFKVENDVVFNQVLISCETDQRTDEVLKYIQEMRECWLGGTTWRGKRMMRLSVCSWTTTEDDIRRTVQSFEQAMNMALVK